jgi:hypothetical protein
MPTNHYFNAYSPSVINEQLLLEDLIVESIQVMGHDVRYLPREAYDAEDGIIGESVNAKFDRAYTLEMYLANVEGYEGDGDFFSKFGLEVRETTNFVVSRRSFEKYIPSTLARRPREGDLIFVPVLKKIFEIKFVEEELLFYSLGKRSPYIYELRCEAFRFSNEDFNTGVEEVDDIENTIAYSVQLTLGAGSGDYHQNEHVYQGANLASATAQADVKLWTASTKKLDVINVIGSFTANANVIGVVSGTQYTVTSPDDMADVVDYDMSDNRKLQTEADNFTIDQGNPFGEP